MPASKLTRWQRLAMLSTEADARAERARPGERRIWHELARWAIRASARLILESGR
jgi:hypothetical protein